MNIDSTKLGSVVLRFDDLRMEMSPEQVEELLNEANRPAILQAIESAKANRSAARTDEIALLREQLRKLENLAYCPDLESSRQDIKTKIKTIAASL